MNVPKKALPLAVIAAVALMGCGKEEPPPPPMVIKIGSVAPLTGGIAHLGKDSENGARLAIDEANCVFHANWTVIPRQTGHAFHMKLDSRNAATRG